MFLEERLPCANVSSSYGDAFSVQVSATLMNRYAVLRHPYVVSRFSLTFPNKTIEEQLDQTIKFFHRIGGMAGGFRFKNISDFTSNDYTQAPTDHDQLCVHLTGNQYQLTRWYDTAGLDVPRRKIKKPVYGTVILSTYDGAHYTPKLDFTVDTTTGIVTVTSPLSSHQTLYAGFEFDIPVQFEADLSDMEWKGAGILSNAINLVEVLNPENI